MRVVDFAVAMQNELDENAHKGGWYMCSPQSLITRLKQETTELVNAIKNNADEKTVLSEAADVANFAMMVADVYRKKGGPSRE